MFNLQFERCFVKTRYTNNIAKQTKSTNQIEEWKMGHENSDIAKKESIDCVPNSIQANGKM